MYVVDNYKMKGKSTCVSVWVSQKGLSQMALSHFCSLTFKLLGFGIEDSLESHSELFSTARFVNHWMESRITQLQFCGKCNRVCGSEDGSIACLQWVAGFPPKWVSGKCRGMAVVSFFT